MRPCRRPGADRCVFERLYARYNRREYVHPDPLEFLYRYEDVRDREIAGLVASSLAYGRVAQILRSVSEALGRMGPSPARFLERAGAEDLRRTFDGFKHRFTAGDELAGLLFGAKQLVKLYGLLGELFARASRDSDETVLPAVSAFAGELRLRAGARPASLIPLPERGSACKRLHLYLRWMVRRDEVDPGGWEGVSASKLVVPLDTHMYGLCRAMGFTSRGRPDAGAALEATAVFRSISPEDPVRYDFALTRLGIREDADRGAFLRECGITEAA